jgi:signal transduction histidine kinase
MPARVKEWIWGAPLGQRALTRLDALLAVLVSVAAVLAVSGATKHSDPQGGVLACAAVLLMTVPVAWRRAHPFGAIATLAVGALFNAIIVGTFVRCGGTLPALILVVYSVGARLELRPAVTGAGVAVVAVVAQAHSDPQLKGFSVGGSVLLLAMWGVGRLVRSREGMVAALRSRTDALRDQRDRTARLAVAADRARVAEDLDEMMGERIGRLSSEAAVAREAIDREPEAARESLTAIEQEGRRTLSDMREIVGALYEETPAEPQPSLKDLDGFLKRALANPAQLTVDGDRCQLPAGVELSAFRIVERLLEPLDDRAEERVQVTLRYEPDALEVAVRGRVRAGCDLQTTLVTAREWVSLHAGTLESQLRSGVSQTEVRLPLVTAHA